MTIKVPLFIGEGESVLVSTKDGKYVFIGKDAFISYKDVIYKQIIKQENKTYIR